jgi:predicted acyltransferase
MVTARSLESIFVSRDLARRDVALDALRGLLILGMLLVNHPPPSLPIYAPLKHAEWLGWTLADTILPGFLFAVGVAIRLTLTTAGGAMLRADSALVSKALRRFALLMTLNFLLVGFPYYNRPWNEVLRLQFAGTLGLIACCSLVVTALVLAATRRTQLLLLGAALVLQWAVYAGLPLPGAPAGTMTLQSNAARVIDEWLFGAWQKAPEDISCLPGLPTIGAITTTLLGALSAPLMFSPARRGVLGSGVLAGLALIAAGQVWSLVMPVSKLLWTGPYSLLMSGIALTVCSLMRAWADGGGEPWLRPLQVAGANALFLYLFAQGLQRLLVYGRLRDAEGNSVRLRHYIHEQWFAPLLQGELGSLVFASLYFMLCYAVAVCLYRRRIFLKL